MILTDIEQRRAYELEGPRAVTFYDRILNRPVPVISKGVDALGRPTTGIIMGDAALASSGEMDISGVFPSTGMNIEVQWTRWHDSWFVWSAGGHRGSCPG
jgi:hypothetical protein